MQRSPVLGVTGLSLVVTAAACIGAPFQDGGGGGKGGSTGSPSASSTSGQGGQGAATGVSSSAHSAAASSSHSASVSSSAHSSSVTSVGSTSSSSGGSMCPAVEPTAGSPCDGGNSGCDYPHPCCTDDVATCQGGLWSIAPGSCSTTLCPNDPPLDGSTCSGAPASCDYGCETVTMSRASATCTSGHWVDVMTTCSTSVQCGGTTCTWPLDVCVITAAAGNPATSACVLNPCAGVPTCTCAASVCAEPDPLHRDRRADRALRLIRVGLELSPLAEPDPGQLLHPEDLAVRDQGRA